NNGSPSVTITSPANGANMGNVSAVQVVFHSQNRPYGAYFSAIITRPDGQGSSIGLYEDGQFAVATPIAGTYTVKVHMANGGQVLATATVSFTVGGTTGGPSITIPAPQSGATDPG